MIKKIDQSNYIIHMLYVAWSNKQITLSLGDMLWALMSGSPGSQHQRRYVGQYVEGKRQGNGTMTYPNGDQYTGKINH